MDLGALFANFLFAALYLFSVSPDSLIFSLTLERSSLGTLALELLAALELVLKSEGF